MEFVQDTELAGLFEEYGIERSEESAECVSFVMTGEETIRVHVAADDAADDLPVREGARTFTRPRDKFADIVNGILQIVHVDQLLLVPVGHWRSVFDAVAFSLAENEDWQTFDAAATVERNTRDPILVGPEDFGMLVDVITALCQDADSREAGMMLVTPAAPIIVEVDPAGAVRVSCGTPVLFDEVADVFSG